MEHPGGKTADEGVAQQTERLHLGWRVAIHAGAALVTILLWAAVTFAFGFVAFGTSVCGGATAHEVRTYRLALLGYGLLVTLVPLAVGTIIRYVRECSWPWFALAAIVSIVAVVGTLSAQPQQWCF